MAWHPSPRSPALLAPARSLAAVRAVLAAGADAVYAGARGWSRGAARAGLPLPQFREAAAICRERGAPLHAAVNVVPGPAEQRVFLDRVGELAGAGAAAVILNDPGAVRLVRASFPDLPITASVGVSALNPADARFYRDLGADAIVLPVGVAAEEVPPIKRESGLRVEVFARCRPEYLSGEVPSVGLRPGRGASGGPTGERAAERGRLRETGRGLLSRLPLPAGAPPGAQPGGRPAPVDRGGGGRVQGGGAGDPAGGGLPDRR